MTPFLYQLAKQFLFQLDPETAHTLTLRGLRMAESLKMLAPFMGQPESDPIEVMGLKFPNRVGLAAGMDKEGSTLDAFGRIGFGFIETGTFTPLAQAGNPKPRAFRCIPQQAIVNHMGINNPGIEEGMRNIAARKNFAGIVGVNISKNTTTPNDKARADYITCLRAAWDIADYITINFSCPNVPSLCDLLKAAPAADLLASLKSEQSNLSNETGRYVPLVMKISPDMNVAQIKELSTIFLEGQLDGLICTNTTTTRQGVEEHPAASQSGGMSGKPLYNKSTEVLEAFAQELKGQIPIIGVGGINSPEDAIGKIKAGASLVQLYSGFIYQGPNLVRDTARALRNYKQN